MDDIVIYQPPSASNSKPRLPGARTSPNVSGASSTSFPVRQTAPQFNQRNDLSKDNITKSRDVSDPSQKSPSDQRYRNDTVQMQENLIVTRNPPDSDDDDFPDIDELLSGMKQKNNLASADPNRDNNNNDNDFPDIDELLSGTKQKSVPASATSNDGNMAEKVDNGTRGDTPDSSRSTKGSTQDPIILSDDESIGCESETDYTDPDVDLTANSYPESSHVKDSELADGNGFGSRAALTSHCLVADHQDDNAQLRLSTNRPRSASPSHGSVTYQASKQMDTDNIQGSTNLDVTKGLEDEGSDVSIEGSDENGDGTCSTKGRKLSAVSIKNPASDSNIPEKSPQLDLVAASPQESDLKNDHLSKRHRRRRRGVPGNICRKRPRTVAPIKLASTASAALRSSAEPQSRAQITALGQEMVNDRSTDDSDDGDYNDRSDATSSQRGCPPRKRVRRTKDAEDDIAAVPTHSFDVSYQAAAATSSSSTQESEEIPIRGYLTLKTIESKVVYCLTFSQELLPEPSGTWRRQDITRSVSSSSDKRDSERSPVQERAMSRPARNSRFSSEDDALLLQLKGEGLSWDEISDRFPERSKGTLQVHYSTKLKRRSETSETMRKRRRNG